MKRYIFMPNGIPGIGGAELYILGKSKWLIEQGWEIHVLSSWYSDKPYKIKELDRYRKENIPLLHSAPYECPKPLIKKTIAKMLSLVGKDKQFEETVIESHTGASALWGELLAERLGAKHIISLIDERFDEVSYKDKLDFFLYKFERKELLGGMFAHQNLFGHIRELKPEDILTFNLQEDPVQDVEDDRLQWIQKADHTICYIGRTSKPYFPNIVSGVGEFARKHPEASVQFVVIGDATLRADLLDHEKNETPNLSLVLTGDMFPLPRSLFRLVDVVAAGSGSARCAAYENVPAIVVDSDNYMANGVFGYDLQVSIGREADTRQRPVSEALEEVLITKTVLNMPRKLRPFMSVADCCEQNMKMLAMSKNAQGYYDAKSICKGKKRMKGALKAALAGYFPKVLFALVELKNYVDRNK